MNPSSSHSGSQGFDFTVFLFVIFGLVILGLSAMFLLACSIRLATRGNTEALSGTSDANRTQNTVADVSDIEMAVVPSRAALLNGTAVEISRRTDTNVRRTSHGNRSINEVVNSLASFRAAEKDRALPCTVCLEDLGSRGVSSGQCLHVIHTDCLQTWLAKDKKNACPVCRVPIEEGAEHF
ncbi:hypothetical protein BWQ96_03166 [Gracilariopsis chorda]|uniref:RING-type domain-containing protein n=1 Tax=Gracilariopsis chorda TaxID=448386 RepID=A0A2V3IYA4_9FLOR|nr:hypothetical protein BWQ96_03166 [Gracilariopsis chorda]|eukprot:PXF47089.1 hypothetical protein BWQ96_03166 [Gracilariopsis chorda]